MPLRDPEDAYDVFQNEDGSPENPTLADIQDLLYDLSAEMHERFVSLNIARRTGMAALWDGLFSEVGFGIVFVLAIAAIIIAL